MAGVVVALARWPARWKSSETGSAHTAKGAARALNGASSEPRSMPSSAREKPHRVRVRKMGAAEMEEGARPRQLLKEREGDAERRLERRLCDGGAGPQRRKRSMMLTFQGQVVVGGGGVEAGGREGEGCSFISFCPAYVLVFASSVDGF